MGIIDFQNRAEVLLRQYAGDKVVNELSIAYTIDLNRLAIEYAESFHREVMEQAKLERGKVE